VVIEHDCASVANRYGLAVCRWDLDAFVALFTEEAVWQRPGVPPMRGHPDIRAFMENQPSSHERVMRHVQGGIVVDFVDQDRAHVNSQTTVYSASPGPLPAPSAIPAMVVEYEDEMIRTPNGWRIQRRDTTVVFGS